MFQFEMYTILARDRQREMIEQLRLNALLRERETDLQAIPGPPAFHQGSAANRRQLASGSAMAEAGAVEGIQ